MTNLYRWCIRLYKWLLRHRPRWAKPIYKPTIPWEELHNHADILSELESQASLDPLINPKEEFKALLLDQLAAEEIIYSEFEEFWSKLATPEEKAAWERQKRAKLTYAKALINDEI